MLPLNFSPRRSERLRQKDDGKSKGPYHRAQSFLAKLGLAPEGEEVSQEASDHYLCLYSKPLAPHHLRAVAPLFSP